MAKRRWMLALGVPAVAAAQAKGQSSVAVSHESYFEDHGRMDVQTETLRIATTVNPWLDLSYRQVFDAISGATPIGAPAINQLNLRDPRSGSRIPSSTITGFQRPLDGVSGASPVTHAINPNLVSLANSTDNREGSDFTAGFTLGPNRIVPEFSYSNESDYISYGFALNYSLELNDKNTTINFGYAHDYDLVLSNRFTYLTHGTHKNLDDISIGITQLLGPRTVASANLTMGHQYGYLNDPYRSVVFDETILNPNAQVVLRGENRPTVRDSQALYLSIIRSVTPEMSVVGSYRFYHDSYGIFANTIGFAWHQKIGKHLIISPTARYYIQSAASFYDIQFPGDPVNDPAHMPAHFSSDYRLSYMDTFTLGLEATIIINPNWTAHIGYQRYWMDGLDGVTMQSTYPDANIFNVEVDVSF